MRESPRNPDTDRDGLSDGGEIAEGTDPLGPDTDGDGLTTAEEVAGGRIHSWLTPMVTELPMGWKCSTSTGGPAPLGDHPHDNGRSLLGCPAPARFLAVEGREG